MLQGDELSSFFAGACRFSSRILDSSRVGHSDELASSLSFLGWGVSPAGVISFSRLAMLASFFIFASLAFVSGSVFYLLLSAVFPFALGHLITEYPKSRASLQRMQALGLMPSTLTKLVVALKQSPNLESAMRFASESEPGHIAEQLRGSLWGCWSGKSPDVSDVFQEIAESWGAYSSEFRMAMYQIKGALSERSSLARNLALDRSLETVLESISSSSAVFLSSLALPVLLLFTFGAVFPLMLVTLIPVLGFIGFSFASPARLSLVLALVLVLVYLYSERILLRRPPTIASPQVPHLPGFPRPGYLRLGSIDLPALPFSALVALIGLVPLAGVYLFSGGSLFFAVFSALWGVGLSISVYLYGTSFFMSAERERLRQLEQEFLKSLFYLSSRLSDNLPPESAVEKAAVLMPKSAVGPLFSEVSRNIKQRNASFEEAVFDPRHGAFRGVHSGFVLSSMRLFVDSSKKSVRAAGEAVFTLARHYSLLDATSRKMREMLSQRISMLKNTSAIFAPAICGLVVSLHLLISGSVANAAARISSIGVSVGGLSFLNVSSFSAESLLFALGFYVLFLDILLARFSSLLMDGYDPIVLKMDTAQSIPVALGVFTLVFAFSKFMLIP